MLFLKASIHFVNRYTQYIPKILNVPPTGKYYGPLTITRTAAAQQMVILGYAAYHVISVKADIHFLA